MPFRLETSPATTVAHVEKHHWITIAGCEKGHWKRWTGPELAEAFPPTATMGQIAERLKCSVCGSRNGNIRFVQDTSPEAQVKQMRTDWGPLR